MNEDPALARTLQLSFEGKDNNYVPRTEHFLDNGRPMYINRLILEESPYLLQHAHNPVNWYPWGEEAFAAAKRQNKPIFLSIGYATCHWCHVMERESFEDEKTAELMNKHVISIKVDREQLPDVDALYMNAVMMMNGSGGWPMSSFLDTDGRTFFGGTYFSPDQFKRLLERVATVWQEDQPALLEQAAGIADALRRANDLAKSAVRIGSSHIEAAVTCALEQFDDFQGGFGDAPKFPQESILYFLLKQAERSDNAEALNAADFSLKRMAAGGIHDQIGGGFHRYAVDNDWLVPHFEKMLYNQGSLARNYTQAYHLTGDSGHARTARRILDYVLRDMRSDRGLFYSATDADSDGGEGRFFTWTPTELLAVLGKNDTTLATHLWGVSESGHLDERSILHRPESMADLAARLETDVDSLKKDRDRLENILYELRKKRPAPIRDEKIITAWNALMITALAEGSETLGVSRYQEAATAAAEELWKSARQDTDTLWRTQFAGNTSIDARQSDYAYFAEALLALYDITGHSLWLERAEELAADMLSLFWDDQNGGFFMAREDDSSAQLIVRPKDLYDASMPAGNAVAMRVLSKLSTRTAKTVYSEYADNLIAFYAGSLDRQSGGHYYLLTGISDYLQGETGARQYAARGLVKATAKRTIDGLLSVQLDIAPGWHINSNQPYQDYLVPTTISVRGGDLESLKYPAPIDRQLGFERSVLSLYEGSVVIKATGVASGIRQIQARLQACSDKTCLPPETLTMSVAR